MVLEGASTVPENDPFTPDSTPTSDLDPYGPGQTSLPAAASTMNMRLPQAVPVLGPLLGYTKSDLKRNLDKGLASASQILNRPLRREEAEALAYNLAKGERTSSVGASLGLGAGLWRAWSTADTFRFPFYKPDLEKFNAEAFAMFRGAASKAALHSLRGLAFGSTGFVIGAVFAKSYASIVAVVAFTSDPRLKDMNQQMREMAAKRSGKTLDSKPQSGPPQGQQPYAGAQKQDDMSPQSGSYDTPEVLSDRQMREQEVGQQSAEPSAVLVQNEAVRAAWRTDKAASYRENADDMSPQASVERTGSSRPESSWDRVRRQSSQQAPRSTTDGRIPPSQGATLGDSFSFSATDEERQLAKSEAQKEFDARVDRERQGKDFEDGSRGKRW